MSRAIVVAYSHGKHGFRARAHVLENGVVHTQTVGLGDTAGDAVDQAIDYVCDVYCREGGVAPPSEIVRVGRIRGALLDAHLF